MATKKTNKTLPLIILLAVCVLIGAAYFVIKMLDLNAEPEKESTVVAIQSKSIEKLLSVTFTDKNGEVLTLVKESGVWYIESDKIFPVSQTKVNEMISTLGTLLASRTIDSDTGNFGFDKPQNVISATYAEDSGTSSVKYTIGDQNSFNSGTYLRDDISSKIYICSSDPAKNFLVEKNELIELDIPAADVEDASTNTITITGTNGKLNVITDDTAIEEFLGDPFNNVDCTDWVAYGCEDDDMLEYGITKSEDKPGVLLNYLTTIDNIRTPATYNIWFGDTLEDGSVYYTITGSTIVYKLSKDKFDTVMSYLDFVPAPQTTDVTVSVTE